MSSHAGRRSGRPLRRGFVSIRGITTAEPSTKQWFHNIRRDRHKRDASTRQAQHRHQQLIKTNGDPKPIGAGRRSGRPLRRGFVSMRGISEAVTGLSISSTTTDTNMRDYATPGGMWSGCAGSRSFQPTDFVSQWTFGGCQGGHRHRWSKSRNRYQTASS